MSPVIVGIIGIGFLLFLMFALRMPVGFAMALAGFLGLAYIITPRAAFQVIGTDIWEQFASYGLTVIPLFIWMGYIAFYSGMSVRLYETAYNWVGQMRGGIAMATVAASALFSAICGSNTATAATMGTIALPEMRKYNYKALLSTGSIAGGGALGVVIPPSVVLIVVGLQTQQGIGKLFLGAIIPGIALAILLLVLVYAVCRWDISFGPPGSGTTWKVRLISLSGVIEPLILFALVIGGLYIGWFTPTEAGAAGAFGALVIALARRGLGWRRFLSSISETLKISCMVMMLVTGAVIFTRFLTACRVPFILADWAGALPVPDVLILIVVIIIYLIGGCLMDALGLVVVTLPVFFPLATALGYDPIWFGILITVVTTMGAITPPVGVVVYAISGLDPSIHIETIFKGATLFLIPYVIVVILMIVFPQMITALP